MLQRKTHECCLMFCLLLLSALPAWASAQSQRDAEPLGLVTGPHYPPFAADFLPHNGLGPFLAERVFEAAGREAVTELRPWRRAYRESLAGQYDAILPYLQTDPRQQDFLFSVPIFKADTHAYVNTDSDIQARSLEELEGMAYCNPLGYTDAPNLKDMRAKGKIIRVTAPHLKNCFRMLVAGRVDFVKINRRVARWSIDHHDVPENAIRPLPFVVEHISLHLMVPRTRPGAQALLDTFDQTFTGMKASGRINELTEEYMDAVRAGGDLH